MTRISQYIAIVGGVKSDVETQLAELEQVVTRSDMIEGLSRTYRPLDENGVVRPAEGKRVQVTVADVLGKIEQLYVRLLDVTRSLDQANAGAAADVIVGGDVILQQVPTSHLLFLERELAALHALVIKLPVLSQAEDWSEEGTEAGQHKTRPVESFSNDPEYFNHTLVKAAVIDGHLVEPQVQVMKRDKPVGIWTQVKFSGALHPRRKRQILDRLIQLREAVKFAREEANSGEAADMREGRRIFEFLLRD